MSLKRMLWTCQLMILCFGLSAHALTTVKTVTLNAYDLVYDPYSQRIYASVNASDPSHGNCIAIINPETGVIEDSVFVGSDPRKMAISRDGEYIYVGLNGAGSVTRYHIPSKTVMTFSLGTGSYGTTYAEDISVQPGNSKVIAVSRYRKGVSPRHDGVAIYEDGIMRPQKTGDHTGSNVIEFSDSPEIVYGYCNETTGFAVYKNFVNEYGIAISASYSGLISGFGTDFEYDENCLYTTSGRVINTQTMQLIGQFADSGKVEPDSTVRRTFVANGSSIMAYNQKTFVKEGQITTGISGASNLIRWGLKGLAYSTSSQVVIVSTDLVPDPPVLTSLVIQGPDHLPGYKGEYKLIATFDDGIVMDVTHRSRWSTDPSTYTSIDNNGLLYVFGTDQAGETTVHADYVWAGVSYSASKEIAFDGVIPAVGNLVRLQINGPRQVVQGSLVQLSATAYFDDDTEYNVTQKVLWSLSSQADFAQIDGSGLLTVGAIDRPRDLVIGASFGYKEVEIETSKTLIVLQDASQMSTSDWPTYQGNPQRSGYVPVSLDPEDFSVYWEKPILTTALKPVTAAAGRVFVGTTTELSCLDSRDGETLWAVPDYCQHQPTYAYGNVYLQVGRHSSSTPKSYLKAYTADFGQSVFTSAFSQQWYTWFAPAVYDGSVYIGGGYYGGMYGFNAFSGAQQWSRSLPQVANWTPAVEGDYSYAYVSGTLYAIDRYYGTQAFTIKAGSSSTTQVPVIGTYQDVLVVNGSSLVSLDLLTKAIRWSIAGSYSGMPSVAEGVVYAVQGGALEARSEETGDFLWAWTPPEGSLKSPMIVTNTHVLACTNANTYAIEILSRESDWSYPASGSLSLGNDTLYIAGSQGVLTAIATPEYIPAEPLGLEIEGPDTVFESSTHLYQAFVTYSDGRIRNRTALCNWTLTETPLCVFDQGTLSTGELLYPEEAVVLTASYTQDETTVADQMPIVIRFQGTKEQLVTRNLEKAMQSKEKILYELQQAMLYEQAAGDIVHQMCKVKVHPGRQGKGQPRVEAAGRPELNKARSQIDHAIVFEGLAKRLIQVSVKDLMGALEIFDPNSVYTEMIMQYMSDQPMMDEPRKR